MAKVRIRFSEGFSLKTSNLLEVSAESPLELAEVLKADYSNAYEQVFLPSGSLRPFVRVAKNGRLISTLPSFLSEGDEIEFFKALAGG